MDTKKPVREKIGEGYQLPENTVAIDGGSEWGNPYIAGKVSEDYGMVLDAAEAVELFKDELEDEFVLRIRKELKGKNLACSCPLDAPCHGDILLKVANSGTNGWS